MSLFTFTNSEGDEEGFSLSHVVRYVLNKQDNTVSVVTTNDRCYIITGEIAEDFVKAIKEFHSPHS